jgi:hypothetical protein
MKRKNLCLKIILYNTLLVIICGCKHTPQVTTTSLCDPYLPSRPLLADTIIAPEFISDNKAFKDTMSSVLGQIYKEYPVNGYSRIYFSIEIDEFGVANQQEVIHVTKNIQLGFDKINKTLMDKLRNWKPALDKRTKNPLKYTLRIEIESSGNKLRLSLMNNDLLRLFEADL